MEKLVAFLGCLVIAGISLVGLSALMALPVKWLWNGVCVSLFAAPEVTFLQAWGLSVLCGILFKSRITTK